MLLILVDCSVAQFGGGRPVESPELLSILKVLVKLVDSMELPANPLDQVKQAAISR